jgi:uncharacterized repeat protein (TIGR03803 family)
MKHGLRSLMTVVLCTAATFASAQTLTTLHNFAGQPNDGNNPYAGLVQGTDGNFYGTTRTGGTNNKGTVFRMTPSGTVTILHSFGGNDGQDPTGGLIQASDGNFYGTTSIGGSGGGGGTVFKITSGGTLTTLVTFNGQGGPEFPYSGLIQGSDGNFYGTTPQGGTNYGNGTVYKITPSGAVTTLYSFACSGSSGCRPSGGLVRGRDGNFYGTTSQGGSGSNNTGSVFKITSSGNVTTLHNFCYSCGDGYDSYATLIQATDGDLYGTTNGGGAHGDGTVFKITTSGTLTTLYSFCPNGRPCVDGAGPEAGLVQGSDGNFYGTTYVGGTNSVGTIFQITPSGTLTTLHTFNGGDGGGPEDALIQANDGNFYGTTSTGGSTGDGTVFKLQLVYYTLTVTPPQNGTVTSSDGYINCPGNCSHSYQENSQVNLTANPAQGYQFESWGGACSGSNPSCAVTMSNNETVSAAFQQASYILTVSISGQGSIASTDGDINCPGTCSHTYLSFTQVTLNAAPAHGWNFAGWSGACTGTGQCNLTMLGNYGVSAYFIQPGSGQQFSAVAPCRLVDTRQTGNPIQGGTSQNFTIPQLGGCNIPTSATAYSLNVTVVPHGSLGYLTVWPAGLAQPGVSNMNSRDGRNKAEAVIVQAGTNNAISIYASNTTDAILDINGYFSAPGSRTYQFYPLAPCRVIDTRSPNGELGGPPLIGGQARNFAVLTSSCMPQSVSIAAYAFNVTVVPYPGGQRLGYLTVWPEGQGQPQVSTLNNGTATSVANAAIVPAGTGGGISVYASDSTQLIVDIDGYFAAPATGGISLYPTAPCRVIDTRSGGGQPWQGEKTVNVAGSPCSPPSNAQAYVFNATVVPPGPMHYLTLWPDPEQRPNASTLNAIDGAVTSNMAIVPNTDGSTDGFASDPTQLILDISSFFAP